MNKRDITKIAAKTGTQIATGSFTQRLLLTISPKFANFHVSQIAGAVVGFTAGEAAEPYLNQAVDDFYNHVEAKKSSKK